MGVINNEALYPITSMLDGATVVGSHPDGTTVQFDISGILNYIIAGLDFVNYNKATRINQHIVGNDPQIPETQNDNINDGNKYFGTILNYPPNSNDDIRFITRLR